MRSSRPSLDHSHPRRTRAEGFPAAALLLVFALAVRIVKQYEQAAFSDVGGGCQGRKGRPSVWKTRENSS
ncbi:hypothetical protein AB0L53_50845 [Nonomuraea sp. NPDC052129]|uniref:hypothetical protein n=1 Tax=Nonomuraea sp. NPDC052129 TaxID=3154651 RepID=UPI00343DA5FF